jgi:hypothetical protein
MIERVFKLGSLASSIEREPLSNPNDVQQVATYRYVKINNRGYWFGFRENNMYIAIGKDLSVHLATPLKIPADQLKQVKGVKDYLLLQLGDYIITYRLVDIETAGKENLPC